MLQYKDNSSRLKKEVRELKQRNKPLYDLLLDLRAYVEREFKKNVVVTMVFRTDTEQAYLYRDSERYKKKPFKSPHQYFQAFDIRSWIYEEEELDKIVDYLNNKYNDRNYYDWSIKVHSIGQNGLHMHIQFVEA